MTAFFRDARAGLRLRARAFEAVTTFFLDAREGLRLRARAAFEAVPTVPLRAALRFALEVVFFLATPSS